ncbi:MAG: hypothetical protein K9G30_06505 [Parvibaculum sp.]|nr:hypothetical protein [Parvibaculum sp.]
MKPDVNTVMQGFLMTLLGDIAPHLDAEYAVGNTSIMGMMLLLAGEEYDRAADIRVAENAEMRALFGGAVSFVDDARLKARLNAAASGKDTSLRITALDATNASLLALLIELHEYVEAADTSSAKRLEERIWDYLISSTERRKITFPLLG